MLEDLRVALRGLSRAKVLTAVLVISIGLGTGANAAVFSLVHAVLLGAPPGIQDQRRLAWIYTSEFAGSPYGRSSFPDFLSLHDVGGLAALAAYDDTAFANVRRGDEVRRVRVVATTANLFDMIGVSPAAGRLFHEGETDPSVAAAVVSHALATFLGGADSLPGQEIVVGDSPYTVVGVAPAGFRGLSSARPADVWIPLDLHVPADQRGDRRFAVLARTSASLDHLQDRLAEVARDLASRHPETNLGSLQDPEGPRLFTAVAYSPRQPGTGSSLSLLAFVIGSAVGLLLLSACINAGTLLLSRALARRRELAVKRALGATPQRLVRQLLCESLVASIAGGVFGLLLATWITTALPALFASDDAELLPAAADPLLVLLTVGIATLAGVAFAIAPALQVSEAPATLALRADSGGMSDQPRGTRVRAAFMAAQLAVSTLLVIGTALLVDGLNEALAGDFGLGTRQVALLSMTNPGGNCSIHDPARGLRFQRALPEALQKTAGVEAVGWAATAPLGRENVRQYTIAAGSQMHDRLEFNVNIISPGYFATLQIPLIEGRAFDWRDTALAEPVAIVDELLARRQFGASALGHALIDAGGERVRIVGIVRSARYRTLQDAPQPTVYLPLPQQYQHCGFLFVRTAGDPGALLPLISGRVRAVDGGVTVERTLTLDQHLSQALAADRLAATLVALCGLIALVMAATGVYGAISDGVARRTREIGLRMALGARTSDVARLVLWQTAVITAAGIVLGVSGALVLERVAGSFVRGVPEIETAVLLRTPILLVLVVAIAAAIPLRRALAVQPTIALRHE